MKYSQQNHYVISKDTSCCNIIDEALYVAPAETKAVGQHIKQTTLNKSALRGSDYHKAVILIYNNLHTRDNSHPSYKELFQTATEVSEILYSPDSQRSSTTILRLHNATFIHGRLCTELFGDSPHRSTIFGRYFHSLRCNNECLAKLNRLLMPHPTRNQTTQ